MVFIGKYLQDRVTGLASPGVIRHSKREISGEFVECAVSNCGFAPRSGGQRATGAAGRCARGGQDYNRASREKSGSPARPREARERVRQPAREAA
ncbi:hypothetical protein SBBP2_1040015 [Burkholderiales bacterium]|nr:hypothetical protein SBBP2_1040015 [Burkholderiales bacterium]